MTSNTISPFQALAPYQKRVDALLNDYVQTIPDGNPLKEPCSYALKNGGKRFRPALVLMIADALGQNEDPNLSALAIELFHTASLIADDLPCMDDDDERRSKPSTHKVFGEAVALLASYALIAEGWGLIAKNGQTLKRADALQATLLAIENASYNTGLEGACGGQFFDLFSKEASLDAAYEVLRKKTGALFEISFVFGWIFGGGNLEKLPQVKAAAHHFGLAFQLMDDIGDQEQDREKGRTINLALILGQKGAYLKAKEEVQSLHSLLKELGLETSTIWKIAQQMVA